MKKIFSFVTFISLCLGILSSCAFGASNDKDSVSDIFTEEDYKNYTLGEKVEFAGVREIAEAQLSGEDKYVYVSSRALSYDSATGQYNQSDEYVCYRFGFGAADDPERPSQTVYFEGNKTVSVFDPQRHLTDPLSPATDIYKAGDYGYIRDTFAPLAFKASTLKALEEKAGDIAVRVDVKKHENGECVEIKSYHVCYSDGKVYLEHKLGEENQYFVSEEKISEEAVAHLTLFSADMESSDYSVDFVSYINNSCKTVVYNGESITCDEIKTELCMLLSPDGTKIDFPVRYNNPTDKSVYNNDDLILFKKNDSPSFYALSPGGKLYMISGTRNSTASVYPSLTHMTQIHAIYVYESASSFDYGAVRDIVTGEMEK